MYAFSDLLEHGSFPSARPGSFFRVCISCSQEFTIIISHVTSYFQMHSLSQILNVRLTFFFLLKGTVLVSAGSRIAVLRQGARRPVPSAVTEMYAHVTISFAVHQI